MFSRLTIKTGPTLELFVYIKPVKRVTEKHIFLCFLSEVLHFFCRVDALGTTFNVQKLASFFLELSCKIFRNDVSFYSFLCTFPRKTPFSMFNNKIRENRRVYCAQKIGTSNTCRYKSFDSRETLNKML